MTATAPRPDGGDGEGAHDEARADGAGAYASPFDALRAVGDVQRQAVDSASQVIAQFLGLVDGGQGPAGRARAHTRTATTAIDRGRAEAGGGDPLGAAGGPDGDLGFARMRADMGRAVDLYVELFRRTFDAYADLTEATLRRRGVTVTGPRPRPAPRARA